MTADASRLHNSRYARTIEASKRARWDIDDDVIRGREFSFHEKFLPDELSLVDELPGLSVQERCFLSQVQGRTYANLFAVLERFIGVKMVEQCRDHAFGDRAAFEALLRFTDEELKHQALFERIEQMIGRQMPDGYGFETDADEVAAFVLGKSPWAVLALTCHIELFTQAHYRAAIGLDDRLSPLFRDIFMYHWREEAQHAVIDELEWQRLDAALPDEAARDAAVDDFIALIAGLDTLLQTQSAADADYFAAVCGIGPADPRAAALGPGLLKAYRWQFIVSGATEPRFLRALGKLLGKAQLRRIDRALSPLMSALPAGVARMLAEA